MEKKELNNLLKESAQHALSFQSTFNDNVREFTKKKDAFVQNALKKYLGADFDFRKDAESIFPRLRLLVKPDGKEEYWHNNDLHQPILILGLETITKMNMESLSCKVEIVTFYIHADAS